MIRFTQPFVCVGDEVEGKFLIEGLLQQFIIENVHVS